MKPEQKKALLAEMELLNRHLRRPQSSDPAYRRFVNWYIDARFGFRGVKKTFLDGSGDNGIDAIVETPEETFFLQSKYEEVPRLSSLPSKELRHFSRVIELLFKKESDPERIDWFEKFKSDSRFAITAALHQVRRNKRRPRFLFITTKLTGEKPEDFEVEDARIIEYRWGLRNFPPPVDKLKLRIKQAMKVSSSNGEFTTYVGLADAQQFVSAMVGDSQDHLFDQNIRTEIKGSSINKGIKTTYEKDSERFWLGNNGVYIVCSEAIKRGSSFTLLFPSVINGYQTLKSLERSAEHHPCDVLVRVLEIGSVDKQRKLLNAVIRRTNSSNPIKELALHAHDEYQVNIAKYLDRYKVFYERRPKEWQNLKKSILTDYTPVYLQDLAQWLATYSGTVPLGTARSSPGKLFEPEEKYEKIFGHFTENGSPASYAILPILAWVGSLFNLAFYYFGIQTERRVAQISRLVFVKAYAKAISSNQGLRKKVLEALEHGRYGRRDLPPELIRLIRKQLRMVIDIYHPHEKDVDLNVFFKNNKYTLLVYNRLTNTKMRGQIVRALTEHVDAVR